MDIYYKHNNESKKATLNVSAEKSLDFVFLGPIPNNNILGSAILVGRYDASLGKVKYQLEGISSSGDMSSLNRQDIIGFCLTNKPNIDPNSLGIYPNWQTIKVVPNPEERDPLELPDAYEYLGDVSIASCSYIEGRELIKEETEVQDFDYAVIKYKWTNQGGKDLDTRTYISTPDRSNVGVVGWGRASNDAEYLIWNSDNTDSGVEGVLVDISALKRDFPSQKDFVISLAAFWFNAKYSGDLSVEVNTYRGGTMSRSGYDWQNAGGTLVQNLSFDANTQLQIKEEQTSGTPLGVLSYNTDTKLGKLSNIGIIEEPEVSILPSYEDRIEFDIYSENDHTPEGPLIIHFSGNETDYAVYKDDVLIVDKNTNSDFVKITNSYFNISKLETGTANYKVYINTKKIEFIQDDYYGNDPTTTHADIKHLPEEMTINQLRFNMKNLSFGVSANLPLGVTSGYLMFNGCSKFNSDLSHWDTSNLTNMTEMFNYASIFNGDISTWNTSNVITMLAMFNEARKFNKSIGNWNTSNVSNMENMFNRCTNFNQDINSWDVSRVINMRAMFYEATSFNKPLFNWDVSKVRDMDYMFNDAKAFNQNLSSWSIDYFKIRPEGFNQGARNWTLPKPIWGGANFTTVDLTGQSGVYITLSKNGGDWITYNLSDPEFNLIGFQKFISYNESSTGFAFKAYSPNNDGVVTAICGFTEDGFARTPNSNTDSIGRLYLDDKQTIVPQVLNIENTKLVAKPTEGIPREYDLYYSLTGANSSETVVIKSAASVKLEDFVPLPPVETLDDYLLRYDFNGDIKDLSENNYEGVQSSPMSFVEGRKTNTQAINFVDHSISINSLSINSDQVTITCWLKGSQDTPGGVFNFGTNYSGFDFFYNNLDGEYNLTDKLPAGQTMASVDKSPYNNVWTFITLVLDRREETKSLHIYANNELISSANITYQTPNYSTGNFIIGRAGTRFPFVGYMQDLKVYPRILTSEEQTQLFNE